MSDYNTLLAAIHALDPFDESFAVDFYNDEHEEVFGSGECFYCKTKTSGANDRIKHTPECPVTHLRNILNDAKPFIKSPTDNGV